MESSGQSPIAVLPEGRRANQEWHTSEYRTGSWSGSRAALDKEWRCKGRHGVPGGPVCGGTGKALRKVGKAACWNG
jgi:hypothetical protein